MSSGGMRRFYFTFGSGHPVYSRVAAWVEVPDGPDASGEARELFMGRFGRSWGMEYGEEEYGECVAAYGYEEVWYLELVPVECELW